MVFLSLLIKNIIYPKPMKSEQKAMHTKKRDTKLYNEKYSFVYDYGKSLIKLLKPKKK